ncbi:unnamed protein product, partial [Amoebophrya sp. A25]
GSSTASGGNERHDMQLEGTSNPASCVAFSALVNEHLGVGLGEETSFTFLFCATKWEDYIVPDEQPGAAVVGVSSNQRKATSSSTRSALAAAVQPGPARATSQSNAAVAPRPAALPPQQSRGSFNDGVFEVRLPSVENVPVVPMPILKVKTFRLQPPPEKESSVAVALRKLRLNVREAFVFSAIFSNHDIMEEQHVVEGERAPEEARSRHLHANVIPYAGLRLSSQKFEKNTASSTAASTKKQAALLLGKGQSDLGFWLKKMAQPLTLEVTSPDDLHEDELPDRRKRRRKQVPPTSTSLPAAPDAGAGLAATSIDSEGRFSFLPPSSRSCASKSGEQSELVEADDVPVDDEQEFQASEKRLETELTHRGDMMLGFLEDILSGLEFVHSFGLVHGDIKPQNIVLMEKDRSLDEDEKMKPRSTFSSLAGPFRAVLIDFGHTFSVAGALEGARTAREAHGGATPGQKGYQGPETDLPQLPQHENLNHRIHFSPEHRTKYDIWAFGIVALEMLSTFFLALIPQSSWEGWAAGLGHDNAMHDDDHLAGRSGTTIAQYISKHLLPNISKEDTTRLLFQKGLFPYFWNLQFDVLTNFIIKKNAEMKITMGIDAAKAAIETNVNGPDGIRNLMRIEIWSKRNPTLPKICDQRTTSAGTPNEEKEKRRMINVGVNKLVQAWEQEVRETFAQRLTGGPLLDFFLDQLHGLLNVAIPNAAITKSLEKTAKGKLRMILKAALRYDPADRRTAKQLLDIYYNAEGEESHAAAHEDEVSSAPGAAFGDERPASTSGTGKGEQQIKVPVSSSPSSSTPFLKEGRGGDTTLT